RARRAGTRGVVAAPRPGLHRRADRRPRHPGHQRAVPHVHLARRVPPAAARGQRRPAPDRHRTGTGIGGRRPLRSVRAQARGDRARERAPRRAVGRTEQRARPRGHRNARPAVVARNQRARPAAPPGARLRHAAVAALAGAGRRRPDRRRAGRDRRQVFRLPRAPARGDRTPPAPRGHHDPDGFRLRRRARPVGGSPPEAGARASGNPRPGPAHPRHDPRRDLAAAGAPGPRPRGLTARHNLLPEPHLIVGAAEAANSIAASAAPTMGASRFPGAPLRKPALALIPLALAACGGPDAPAVVGDVDPTAAYEVHAWPLPATEGSAQPDMAMTADGRLLLSWISSIPGRRNALQFVSLSTNGRWQSAPRTIAVGETLAANWANIPHITATPDGTLWVHWLQRIGEGYAAD